MIKVDIATALFLYLFITAIGLLIVWSFFSFGTKLKTFSSDEKHIWRCSICTFTYIDSRNELVSKCPRCKSFNQRVSDDDKFVLNKTTFNV
ncbi:MAG: hypothetical protein ABIH85_00360 [Candidatus Omnitrophota bacterium]|nr:hypothetical protein [Candidatus Omnitrophota bacterium]